MPARIDQPGQSGTWTTREIDVVETEIALLDGVPEGGGGSAVGVLLGGVLTGGPSWEWVFYVNVPIGVIVFIGLTRTLPTEPPTGSRVRLDVPGALLVTAGTGTAIYGLIGAGDRGWVSAATLGLLAGAVILYAVFVVVQRTSRSPLMDLGILTRRPVTSGIFLILVATALMISVFFLGSFYLQHHEGFGALQTGLLFLPVAVATIIGAQAAGRLVGSAGARPTAVASMLIAAVGLAVPAFLQGPMPVVIGVSLGAAGIGAAFVASSTTALSQVAHHEAGLASGLLSTFHEFGASLGVAVVSSIAAASLAGSTDVGFSQAFTFAAVTAAVSAVLALLIVPTVRPAVADSI
ncbi:MFS transporter [Herbidospora solisilvae]|uniref:MFS transporter n=1 Tax=Herbidospora solisilvae TaxID=2696284 RepID=UPI001929AB20|nr:MFS transporter [Herbidospora solisilvae]